MVGADDRFRICQLCQADTNLSVISSAHDCPLLRKLMPDVTEATDQPTWRQPQKPRQRQESVKQNSPLSVIYLFPNLCVWIVDCGEEGTVSVHQIRSAFIVYKQTGARVDGCTISIVSSSPFSYTQFALIAIIFYWNSRPKKSWRIVTSHTSREEVGGGRYKSSA